MLDRGVGVPVESSHMDPSVLTWPYCPYPDGLKCGAQDGGLAGQERPGTWQSRSFTGVFPGYG